MPTQKICLILIAGLDHALIQRAGGIHSLPVLGSLAQSPQSLGTLRPSTPAVTSTMQATLTTGTAPTQHGIIANGLYTHGHPDLWPMLDLTNFADFRKQVSFWEQSNQLLDTPRFWKGSGKRVAMLFWQNSMDKGGGAADIVVTPKPTHTPDGKTLTACWSSPADLYGELTGKLGPFPLHEYWGPMASLGSSRWIINAAQEIWNKNIVDLELVYIPALDYAPQRLGPSDPKVVADLRELDAALAPLVDTVRQSGGQIIIAGDYGMNAVSRWGAPNLALRRAGLLTTKPDDTGKLLVDHDKSAAFAMVDHQIAHVYCQADRRDEALAVLQKVEGVADGKTLVQPKELEAYGLNHARSGDIVLLAAPNAWFIHDWWENDSEKPAWQFSVDIHRKPGYDPRELFFDRQRKCIPQDPALVKGSHGHITRPDQFPILLCDPAIAPWKDSQTIDATALAPWLRTLLGP